MTKDEKTYIEAILNTLDALSKTGALRIYGLAETQQFSGCMQALQNMLSSPKTEEE